MPQGHDQANCRAPALTRLSSPGDRERLIKKVGRAVLHPAEYAPFRATPRRSLARGTRELCGARLTDAGPHDSVRTRAPAAHRATYCARVVVSPRDFSFLP